MFSISRVVTFLTPLVFAPAAAVGTAWVAKHFPGLPAPTKGDITAVEITGFTTACGVAATWLRGHRGYEKDLADLEKIAVTALLASSPEESSPEESSPEESSPEEFPPAPDLSDVPFEAFAAERPTLIDNGDIAAPFQGVRG